MELDKNLSLDAQQLFGSLLQQEKSAALASRASEIGTSAYPEDALEIIKRRKDEAKRKAAEKELKAAREKAEVEKAQAELKADGWPEAKHMVPRPSPPVGEQLGRGTYIKIKCKINSN